MQSMTDVIGTVHAGEPAWTVGIDLGRRAAHEAVLRAPDGSERRTRFAHSRDGIDGFVGELAGLRGRVLVIIEPTATRWQALAEELSGQGIEVRQVNAATVAKLRGARDITGAKSDRVDARTLASALDYSRLVRPDSPVLSCAHALCLERLRLRRERRRLRGAVKVCLDTIWPEFLQTFRGGERGVTARAVIAVTGGDPARARRLGRKSLSGVCERRHPNARSATRSSCSSPRRPAARLATALPESPTLPGCSGRCDAAPSSRASSTRSRRSPAPLPPAARRTTTVQPAGPHTTAQSAAARRSGRRAPAPLPTRARQARRLRAHRPRLR